MEEITFSVPLNNREGSTIELFIREHWLAKTFLNNAALSLYIVMMMKQLRDAGNLFIVEKLL